MRSEAIKWPDAAERAQISARFARDHGLPNAVGIVDGTPIVFSQRPGVDGGSFWSRKKHYSINLQLVCDDKGKIRYYLCGWPGSCFDSTVWGHSKMARNLH